MKKYFDPAERDRRLAEDPQRGRLVDVLLLCDHRSYRAGQRIRLNEVDAKIAAHLGIVAIPGK